jgi:sucrose-6-phosphate hydrolase SacC (GH32 family)
MKRGKKPTRQQKKLLTSQGYDPKKYRVLYELDYCLVLRDQNTKQTVVVYTAENRRHTNAGR